MHSQYTYEALQRHRDEQLILTCSRSAPSGPDNDRGRLIDMLDSELSGFTEAERKPLLCSGSVRLRAELTLSGF